MLSRPTIWKVVGLLHIFGPYCYFWLTKKQKGRQREEILLIIDEETNSANQSTYIHFFSLSLSMFILVISPIKQLYIVRFTLNSSTRIIEFRGFLSQIWTNFHEILHTLFSIHVVTTLNRS